MAKKKREDRDAVRQALAQVIDVARRLIARAELPFDDKSIDRKSGISLPSPRELAAELQTKLLELDALWESARRGPEEQIVRMATAFAQEALFSYLQEGGDPAEKAELFDMLSQMAATFLHRVNERFPA